MSCLLMGCGHGRPSRGDRVGPATLGGPARVALGNDLEYRETTCPTEAGPIRLRALRLQPGGSVQLRALQNATAHRDARCLQRYGGADIRSLVTRVEGFRVLGAANGNFFHEVPTGFRANGMIWSAEGRDAARLIAPLQPTDDPDYRGDRVVLVDAEGGHEIRVSTGRCEPGSCLASIVATRFVSGSALASLDRHRGPLSDASFVAALREAFPGATLAMQVTPAYEPAATDDRAASAAPSLSSYVRCTPDHAWTCAPHPVTWLCLGATGSVAVITAESAHYAPLASALAPRGACGTECAALYLLDGGGSAQIGYSEPSGQGFLVRYAGKADPRPADGCFTYRPVDHYLVFGLPEPRSGS